MWGRTCFDDEGAAAALAEGLAPDHPHAERRRRRRADEPAALVLGLDVADHDPLVAERGAGEQPLEGVEERGVAAPVDRQGLLGAGGLGRLEVRRDVAAAEGVDGLLRVADQHHRGVAGERAVEHLPLDRVGVLELVDEHDLPPAAHPLAGGAVGLLEGVGELAEEVVVGQDPEPALAALDLLADLQREADPPSDRRGAVLVGGLEPGLRVVDGVARDRHRLVVGEDGSVGVEGERAEVEVVDGLPDQVVEVLDQAGAGVGVAGDAERVEDHRAELVGGGDGRSVEADQRVGDPAMAEPALLGVPAAEHPDQLGLLDQRVVLEERAGSGVVAEHPLGLDELGADAFAELLAGGAPEGDDQHLLQPGVALGDVAGDQGTDGPGLAGAGAGLEQDGAGGQLAGDVEGGQLGGAHSGPILSPPVSSGSQIVQAWSGSPAASSFSTGARGPKTRWW